MADESAEGQAILKLLDALRKQHDANQRLTMFSPAVEVAMAEAENMVRYPANRVSGDGTPGPARPNAPEFPKYEGYDGPRIVQRLNYAADVLDVLAEWIGTKPSLPYRDLIQLAKDFRSMADEELEELWPK